MAIMFPLLCVTAILVSIIYGSPVDTEEKYNILFDQHLKKVQQFPCAVPKERSFSVNVLFKNKIGTDEILIPSYTTLHRCDVNSGCCHSVGEVCTAVRQEKIDIVFRTVSQENKFKVLQALNHTECMCVKINSQPKRLVQTTTESEEVELISENTLNLTTSGSGSGSVSKPFLTYTLHLCAFGCILTLRSILPA